jgi:hypothetical protein
VAAILGIYLSAWATVVAMTLVFSNATERARLATEQPKRMMLRGVVILLTVGLAGAVMLANPAPPVKLAGWLAVLFLLGVAAIGTSGISREAGRRIQAMDPGMAAYPAFVRGSAYVVGATILPILGWFALAPLLLIASLGAGWKAVMSSARPEMAEA